MIDVFRGGGPDDTPLIVRKSPLSLKISNLYPLMHNQPYEQLEEESPRKSDRLGGVEHQQILKKGL